jgi:GT2 family glycosyltransferase
MTVTETQSNRVVSTPHGEYLVQGLDCFAVAGDIRRELTQTIEKHNEVHNAAPDAVVWDDCVLEFRSFNLSFSLLRVYVPHTDPLISRGLDNRARAAVRLHSGSDFELPDVNESLLKVIASGGATIAHAPGLMRFIGWPEQAPAVSWTPPRPSNRAKSISVIINYRDKGAVTADSLAQIQKQVVDATLELILVDNQSRTVERQIVEEAVHRLFGDRPDVVVRHARYDAPFNHSYQCNFGASLSTGEVLAMMSNDCHLVDPHALQTMADWALEPGIGGVMPRIVGAAGAITSAGVSIQPAKDDREEQRSFRIQDCEVEYLSRIVRQTVGVTFACAAISRAAWFAAGGLDAIAFPTDYNDADFSLRCANLGLRHMYLGNIEAHHQAGRGDRRTREQAESILSDLLKRHDLSAFAANNPYGIRFRRMPSFNNDAANEVCDLVRLYRIALNARSAEGASTGDLRFLRTFEAVVAAADLARDAAADALDEAGLRARHAGLYEKIRAVCHEYTRIAPAGSIPARYLASFQNSHDALERIETMAARSTRETFLPPVEPPANVQPQKPRSRLAFAPFRRAPKAVEVSADPDTAGEYFSFSDRSFDRAPRRLLVFADAMGPTQQYVFQIALNRARRSGEIALRVFSESDLARLISAHGDAHLIDYMRRTIGFVAPTVCVFSRFGDRRSYSLLREQLASVTRVFLIDDDLFTAGVALGLDRYRQARNARRIAALATIAGSSDLIVATSAVLAERMKAHAPDVPIACSGLLAGGRPCADPTATRPPRIGYYASAAHHAELEMMVPALLRVRQDFPTVAIEIRGPVADSPAAVRLGDAVLREPSANPDYALFRKSLSGLGWSIGLAPLCNTAYNRAKQPIKWLEYTEAGIATIASNVETYRPLGAKGAVLLAGPDEWYGRIAQLLHREARGHELLSVSNRMVLRDHGWPLVEARLLALLDRAKASRVSETDQRATR